MEIPANRENASHDGCDRPCCKATVRFAISAAAKSDPCMGGRQISIQRQRSLAAAWTRSRTAPFV